MSKKCWFTGNYHRTAPIGNPVSDTHSGQPVVSGPDRIVRSEATSERKLLSNGSGPVSACLYAQVFGANGAQLKRFPNNFYLVRTPLVPSCTELSPISKRCRPPLNTMSGLSARACAHTQRTANYVCAYFGAVC